MPVGVRKIGDKWRVTEPDGGIAHNAAGTPVDGKGHDTREGALRQQRAINANLHKSGLRTLYVHRALLNADELVDWARHSGFRKTLEPDDMHVTIAFSRAEVDWARIPPMHSRLSIYSRTSQRSVESMGDKGASALIFKSEILSERHNDFRLAGASWDWPSYRPHITISYTADEDLDVSNIQPFAGTLLFGPETYAEVVEDWDEKITERKVSA